jgi:hypothetical protein
MENVKTQEGSSQSPAMVLPAPIEQGIFPESKFT